MATKTSNGMPKETNKIPGSSRLPVGHDRDVARANELHTHVVKLLSSTTNNCLSELGYYPNIQSDLRGALDRNHSLEANNTKLFEDNRRLAGVVAVQNDRLAFLDTPQSEQLQKVLEIKDKVCYLQADIGRKNQEYAKLDGAYRTLHADHQRLQINYAHLVKELQDARMDIARYRGVPANNVMMQPSQSNANHVPLRSGPSPWLNGPGMPPNQLHPLNVERLPERRTSLDGQMMGVGPTQNNMVRISSASTTPTHTSAPVHSLQQQRRVSDGLSRQRPPQSPDPYATGWRTMNGDAAGPPPRPLHQVPSMNIQTSNRPITSLHGPAHVQHTRPLEQYLSTAATSPHSHPTSPTTIQTPSEVYMATHNSHPDRSLDNASTPTSTQSLHFPMGPRIRIPTDQGSNHRLDGIASAPPVPSRTFQAPHISTPPMQSPSSYTRRPASGQSRMVGFVDLTIDDSSENPNAAPTNSSAASPAARTEGQSAQSLKRPSSVVGANPMHPVRNDANKRPRISDPTSRPHQQSPITGYHTPVSQASSSPNIRASEPAPPVMQEPTATHALLPSQSPDTSQPTSVHIEGPSDQAPVSSSDPQSPNTEENTERPIQDTHTPCTPPIEEAIHMIFMQDADEPEGKRCRLCDCRYAEKYITERPPAWMHAKMDDLIQHCATEHPAAWEHLQKCGEPAED
ncbi:hypothetical protein SERLA73DRAFT_71204 [Serpula lacrymans var. lacrymans S7.3]|uniref:Uncharacterized protein n=1 Tax=Serpula lacrymans var. lacrymans (strain S7.3) TaxID=936435 RepID=F8PPI0_SERL3|nr:hypothetical protein SERLA73DRAFT_71204 [Serpula lacrymans var. lacrymans S7.3]